ncbi:MAG: HD domain-containing protein [Acidimicrobiia bacterium]|nr:HD domain-containing protein [Acidimicrobiia bacterium]
MVSTSDTVADGVVGGDVIDVLSHSLQCADILETWHPHDEELVVAGLVHDVGHLLVPGDADGHGRHGADAVRPLLGERVAALVELHVAAKRYLVATDAGYRRRLSHGSIRTLELQGGPLHEAEVAAFEASPHAADAVALRHADEAAKVPGRRVAPLEDWAPLVVDLANRSAG